MTTNTNNQPRELGDEALEQVNGGVELKPAQVTSYQLGVLDNDANGAGPHLISISPDTRG